MSLETMTQGIRAQVLRAGDGWVRRGRVVGATALRTGARSLTKTAARLDVLAARLVPDTVPAAAAPEAADTEAVAETVEVVAAAEADAAEAVASVEAAPVVEAPAVSAPAVSAPGGGRADAGSRRRARRRGKG